MLKLFYLLTACLILPSAQAASLYIDCKQPPAYQAHFLNMTGDVSLSNAQSKALNAFFEQFRLKRLGRGSMTHFDCIGGQGKEKARIRKYEVDVQSLDIIHKLFSLQINREEQEQLRKQDLHQIAFEIKNDHLLFSSHAYDAIRSEVLRLTNNSLTLRQNYDIHNKHHRIKRHTLISLQITEKQIIYFERSFSNYHFSHETLITIPW